CRESISRLPLGSSFGQGAIVNPINLGALTAHVLKRLGHRNVIFQDPGRLADGVPVAWAPLEVFGIQERSDAELPVLLFNAQGEDPAAIDGLAPTGPFGVPEQLEQARR